jgi:hypothetical protein
MRVRVRGCTCWTDASRTWGRGVPGRQHGTAQGGMQLERRSEAHNSGIALHYPINYTQGLRELVAKESSRAAQQQKALGVLT